MEIVHKQEYRNRKIIVVRIGVIKGVYHNGYVSVVNRKQSEKPHYEDLQDRVDTVLLTFSDYFTHFEKLDDDWRDKWYVGFDTAHFWNDENPETKTKESVIEKARELCDEMVRKGI